MDKIKLNNIEFLRFVFSFIIVYFHILHSNIIPYTETISIYSTLAKLSNNAGVIVECFFLISGYFLWITLQKEQGRGNVITFIAKKVIRLGPVLWFSLIVSVLFSFMPIGDAILNFFFLQCTGLSLSYKGINWYISPLFFALIFYYAIIKNYSLDKSLIFISVLVYFSYLVNITYCHGSFGRETVYGFVNLGLARALAGVGLGYLIGFFLEKVSFSQNKIFKTFFSLIEVSIFIYLMGYFLLGCTYSSHMIVVILFSVMFICFIKEAGYFSQILNLKIFSLLGRYTYSIYVMQQIGFNILKDNLWKTDLIYHPFICIFLSILFCFVIGVITYHVIEMPSSVKSKKITKSILK